MTLQQKIEEVLKTVWYDAKNGFIDYKATATALLSLFQEEENRRLEELAVKVELRFLIEAEIPGSRWTLDWKQGHNAGLEKAAALLRSTKNEVTSQSTE